MITVGLLYMFAAVSVGVIEVISPSMTTMAGVLGNVWPSFAMLGGYLSLVNRFFPVDTLLAIVTLTVSLEVAIMAWGPLMWITRKIRLIG